MEEKVSVIIPNYNGRNLLSKTLPKIMENCSNCEIMVIDDASTDDSVQFIKKNFKKVHLLINSKNLGFSKSVNIGAEKATGNLLLLLNSDVSPRADFLKKALQLFSKNPKRTFGVGLADYSHEGNKVIIRGRGGAKFIRGFVNHFALTPKSDETLWVSGGSSLIDREKFLNLGGFDPIYAPFYWEDVDLCYRAQKAGFLCFFNADSKVDHYHEEGAIKKTKSEFFIKSVAYKNQFIFVWKNTEDYLWVVLHFIWLPFHFARALVKGDTAFFVGFFWALTKIPQLILRSESQGYTPITDREVLKKFEKP